jgi:hypothetical protein
LPPKIGYVLELHFVVLISAARHTPCRYRSKLLTIVKPGEIASAKNAKESMMKIKRQNIFTNETNVMELAVEFEQLERWHRGGLIQDVMPHLTADEREFLMTGCLPGEFDKLFAEDPDPERTLFDHEEVV